MIAIETYNDDGEQRILYDAIGLKWSTHYGVDGSGYGYLKFVLRRKIGYDYVDIGYGYEVKLRKYLNTFLFHGQIREIEEKSGPDGDEIHVTCLGWVIVAQDDELLRAFCDTRLAKWKPVMEIPTESFRPDRFTTGANSLGLYVHANNGVSAASSDYTELGYEFFVGEVAERFKCDLSLRLGMGTLFDATTSAIDSVNGYVDYANDSGESSVTADMTLWNYTQAKTATVQSINTGTNRITVDTPADVTGWSVSDELAIYGPMFSAQISGIAAAVITYAGTIVGEDNIAANQTLVNITQKAVATVQSNDTGANTITVSDSNHIEGWAAGDIVVIGAPYFEATFVSDAGTTITYSSPIGERVASTVLGAVLHNVDEDEYAEVASWTIVSNQLDVTDAGDITANWTNGDTLRIYTPYRVKILDSADNVLWPVSDWRQGAIVHDRTSINVASTGSPTKFKIRLEVYVSGAGNEASFAQLSNLKVYSTEDACDTAMLAKAVVALLSAAGHDWSSSEGDIAAISKVLEPMVFEYVSPTDAMRWACGFGDGSGSPVAWGIKLDDTKTMFLEIQDRSTVDYVVRRSAPMEASIGGSVQGSLQQVRGVYSDEKGEQQVTAWQADSDYYFSARYRRASIRLDNVDNDTDAVSMVQLYLDENKEAKRSAKYVAGDGAVFTPDGLEVPFDEVQATGRLVKIEDWRAAEVSGTDLRQAWTMEQIVLVEVDYDAGRVSLTPAGARSTFERYMAELALLAQR